MDINTASQFENAETAEGFDHRKRRDTKGPIRPVSKGNSYVFAIFDAFTHYVITKPTTPRDAGTDADVLLKNWMIIFGPIKLFAPDECSE